jgi:orotate phosphoribosyltransferase
MINNDRIKQLIDDHFDGSHEDEIAENLREYEPRLERLSQQEEQRRKNTLVDLIASSRAFEIKKSNGFQLENSPASNYYIRLLEVVEDRQGYELAELMASYIDRVDDQIDRVVGILKKGNEQQREISEEKYHLSSIVSTVLRKRSADLIYRKVAENEFEFWQDGRLSAHKKIAIVDEVITTGTGVIQAVKYLQKFHQEVIVNDVFVYVARATGQHLETIHEQLEQLGVNLHCLIDGVELIEGLRSRNYPEISLILTTNHDYSRSI